MSDEPPSIKITLLGNPGVGKTCIIARYIENVYNENNASTIGANYSEKTIKKKGREYQLDIWDTAGQEKFHSLGKHFYKDSYIVCLVYDITNQESVDALKSVWYPDIQKYGEKYAVLAVIGNKSDLYENEELADEQQAKDFAKEINATFMLTSAKTGDGIEKLFDVLTDKIIDDPKFAALLKGKGDNIVLDKNTVDEQGKKKKKFC